MAKVNRVTVNVQCQQVIRYEKELHLDLEDLQQFLGMTERDQKEFVQDRVGHADIVDFDPIERLSVSFTDANGDGVQIEVD